MRQPLYAAPQRDALCLVFRSLQSGARYSRALGFTGADRDGVGSIGSQGQPVQVQTAVDTAMLGVLRIGAIAIPTPSQCMGRDVAYRVKVDNQ
jgi:hypothetical protein